jgi:hypothetical protein
MPGIGLRVTQAATAALEVWKPYEHRTTVQFRAVYPVTSAYA